MCISEVIHMQDSFYITEENLSHCSNYHYLYRFYLLVQSGIERIIEMFHHDRGHFYSPFISANFFSHIFYVFVTMYINIQNFCLSGIPFFLYLKEKAYHRKLDNKIKQV